MEFSVIIPVYNAEKNIGRCIESIQSQSLSDFELILIDDGSRDNSYGICLEYANADSRIKVIHKENGGASAARNTGLDSATGEWVCFVDSDDLVESNYLESIYRAKENSEADVVFFGYTKVNSCGKTVGEYLPECDKEGLIDICCELSRSDMFGYTWIKAYRRQAIGESRFIDGISIMEDEIFACEVIKGCRAAAVVKKPLYRYVCDSADSLMGRTNQDFCRVCDAVFGAWRELLSKSADKDKFLSEMAGRMVERCRYYGFERELDCKSFFSDLSEASFVKYSPPINSFAVAAADGNVRKMCRQRGTYRLKQKIAKLLGR